MIVKQLKVNLFRNPVADPLIFADQGNIILGANGQGTPNLLEAIHDLTILRSFRNGSDTECIQFGSDYFQLSVEWLEEAKARKSGENYRKYRQSSGQIHRKGENC